MFGVLAPRGAQRGDGERRRRRTGRQRPPVVLFPSLPDDCMATHPTTSAGMAGNPKKKREFFCHTMKLYNVNIYKEITFICGYYGENDLVNKVLVMFAHF